MIRRSTLVRAGLLSLTLTFSVSALGQDDAKPPKVKAKTVQLHVGSTIRFFVESKRPLREAMNENDKIAWLSRDFENENSVLITGIAPGESRITITDGDKRSFIYDFVVRRLVTVPLGTADYALQHPSGARIKKAVIDNEAVARVILLAEDPSKVRISPLAAGQSICTLTDEAGKEEVYDVKVIKADLVVTIDGTDSINLKSKKPISEVFIEQEGIVQAKAFDAKEGKGGKVRIMTGVRTVVTEFLHWPVAVSFTGLQPGVVRVTLTDSEGNQEILHIGVINKK